MKVGGPIAANDLLAAFARSGYLFPLIKGTEVAVGAFMLTGLFVPLALTALAPIVVNIIAFHVFLAPGNIGVLAVMVAAGTALAWTHRATFAPLLRARPSATPAPLPAVASPPRSHAA